MSGGTTRERASVGTLEDLQASAARMTGLTDFGDPSFEEGFRILLDDYAGPAGLTGAGNAMMRSFARGALVARLLAEQGFKDHPEHASVPIQRPIFVTGLPRTGTTALHRLLTVDPRHQGLELWLTEFPQPRPPRATWEDNPVFTALQKAYAEHHVENPEFMGIHYMDAASVEECWRILRQSGLSVSHETLAYVPTYSAWLAAQDWTPAYQRHKANLQLIGLDDADRRWVLKNPSHLVALDALLAVYPDALVVQTHRDPVVAVASACSLSAEATRGWSTVFTDATIGETQLDLLARSIQTCAAARQKADPAQFVDVDYDEFVSDPVGTVERIYTTFGLDFDEQVRAAVGAVHAQSRSGAARPQHRYSLADYGLTEGQVRERFADHPAG